ncbi:MAG: hypothetical protein RL748_255 [Pseudomonadota bacterium]|jgi:hypothetical protein
MLPSIVSLRTASTPICSALLCLAASVFASQAHGATLSWPGHVSTGQNWVNTISPANNAYSTPASITLDSNSVLHATAQCGSFTAQLLLQSYEGIITADVLTALTGSNSPSAQEWHDAIDPAQSHPDNPSNGVSLQALDQALASPTGRTLRSNNTTLLAVGDILAAKYSTSSATGHVMTVSSITAPAADQALTLSGTRVIPGVTSVKRWTVQVLDSSSSVHGSSDSRYQKDSGEDDGNDHGIGSGTIYLYEDATVGSSTRGQLVGWTWSTASSYTYQFTQTAALDNNGKTTYRPMVIGRFSGAGL